MVGEVGDTLANVLGVRLGLQLGDLPATLWIAEDISITGCRGVVRIDLAGIDIGLANGNLFELGDQVLHPLHPTGIIFQLVHRQHRPQHPPLTIDVGPVFRAGGIPRPIGSNSAIEQAILPQTGDQIVYRPTAPRLVDADPRHEACHCHRFYILRSASRKAERIMAQRRWHDRASKHKLAAVVGRAV